eukprot:Rmarinus@m.2271
MSKASQATMPRQGEVVACVAVIGQENNPLFIKVFDPVDPSDAAFQNVDFGLRYHFIVHSALDVIEEKWACRSNAQQKHTHPQDSYLGMLYPTEDHRVYGYATNTKTKFVAVLHDVDSVRDPDVNTFFHQLHLAYVGAVSNPFYNVGGRIDSVRFQDEVATLVSNSFRPAAK